MHLLESIIVTKVKQMDFTFYFTNHFELYEPTHLSFMNSNKSQLESLSVGVSVSSRN